MKLTDQVDRRIRYLISEGDRLTAFCSDDEDEDHFQALGWMTSVGALLTVMFPDDQRIYRRVAAEHIEGGSSIGYRIGKVTAVLKAALSDIESGILTSIADEAQARVFDDFVDHAEHYLQGGKVAQAGVIAGVVFEDTIRRLCTKFNVGAAGVPLDQLISGLEKQGLFTPVKAKRARAAADLRTRASHADWDKFQASDVTATIAVVRELVQRLE